MVNLNVVQNRPAKEVARRRKRVEGVCAKLLPGWTLNEWEEIFGPEGEKSFVGTCAI